MTGSPGMQTGGLDSLLTVSSLRLTPAWRVPPGALCGQVGAEMTELGFDHAPIAEDARLVCFLPDLVAAPPESTAVSVAHRIQKVQHVTPSTALQNVMHVLRDHDHVIVEDTLGGVGVITHSDLAHPVISSSVFHTVMLIEHGLSALLELFDDPQRLAHESLKPRALQRIGELIAERERRNLELSFVKSMSLEDRFDLVLANAELWSQVADSKKSLKRWKKRAQQLRNDLAHSGSLLDTPEDPADVLRLVQDLERFARLIWERVADKTWTRFAFAEVIGPDDAVLAGRGAAPDIGARRWVITADNPSGLIQNSDPSMFLDAQDRLRSVLTERALPFVEGRAGRLEHWEHSFIVACESQETILNLTAMFDQLGVFELTRDSQRTLRCEDGTEARCVPRVR